MDFRTVVPIEPLRQRIGYERRGLLIGSCFADEIGRRMQRLKFPVAVNPFGILFNPASIAATLDALRAGKRFSEADLVQSGDLWVSMHHHGSFASPDKQAALQAINAAAEAGEAALREADYLILTLGTAWVYDYLPTGAAAANCHKLPATDFRRRRMTADEIVAVLESALAPYLDNKQVLITVSPVRHANDPVEDRLSKSTLIVAAAALAERHPAIEYFPAYEIVTDELRDYRFYAADMRHLTETAVEYVWSRFTEAALPPETQELCARIARLQEAADHRPLNPGSENHRAFRQKMAAEAAALQKAWPALDFSPETEAFSDEKHG